MSKIFSECDKNFNPEELDAKSKMVLEASKLAADATYKVEDDLQKVISGEKPAKYKIEILLPPSRKTNEATACAVTMFISGGKLHGGGDELLYLCRSEKDAKVGCGDVLKGPLMIAQGVNGGMSSVYYCDKCKKHVNRELCASTILYKLPINKIAENVYRIFRQLDSNADIYLKYQKTDIREATRLAQEGKVDALQQIPTKMEYAIYTLKNILKDAANDSQIISKITTFLKV